MSSISYYCANDHQKMMMILSSHLTIHLCQIDPPPNSPSDLVNCHTKRMVGAMLWSKKTFGLLLVFLMIMMQKSQARRRHRGAKEPQASGYKVGRVPVPNSDLTFSRVAYGTLHIEQFPGKQEREKRYHLDWVPLSRMYSIPLRVGWIDQLILGVD